jgi:4-carboxymuconolactone decarboxylase
MRVRREVLGDEHVERAVEATTDFTRDFQDLITRYAWGEIWARPGLDRKTRSCITLTALVALGRDLELAMHVRAALNNGVTPDEIKEVLLQSAIYCASRRRTPPSRSRSACWTKKWTNPAGRAGRANGLTARPAPRARDSASRRVPGSCPSPPVTPRARSAIRPRTSSGCRGTPRTVPTPDPARTPSAWMIRSGRGPGIREIPHSLCGAYRKARARPPAKLPATATDKIKIE